MSISGELQRVQGLSWVNKASATDLAPYFQGKTVLVTGAAGFVGSHLIHRLHALGARVVAVDKVRGEALPGVRWVIADVLELAPKCFEGLTIDLAFHLAAIVGVSYTGQHPAQTLAVNAIGTSRVVKLVRNLGAKVVCAMSSSEVYGEPEVTPITEESNLNPLSIYAWSKLCAEHILEAHTQSGDMCGVIIRPFNVYGTHQRSDFVVSRFLWLARQGLPLTIAGTGTQRRIFTFVDDLIYGMLLAVMKNKVGFHVYNIAGEGDISIAELADLIVSLASSKARPILVQLSDLQRDATTEVHMRVASIEKARRELGYRPQIPLERGLKLTYENLEMEAMIDNPEVVMVNSVHS